MTTVAIAVLAALALIAAGIALYLVISERRRHGEIELELSAQASHLEQLVESTAAIASSIEEKSVLEQTVHEAERLFDARASLLPPGERGGVTLPIRVRDTEIASLRLQTERKLSRGDLARAAVLTDVAGRAVENARLLEEATIREAARTELSDQLITAEQDERRRLALFLHDGPVQSMAGIALMLDGALNAIDTDQLDQAKTVIGSALDRHRQTIRELRDLSFNLEPVVLRDQGFDTAVRALAEQLGMANEIKIDVDVEPAEELAENTQAALYQIIREALNGAIRRGPPTQVAVRVERARGRRHRDRDRRRRAGRAAPRELRRDRRAGAHDRRPLQRRAGRGRRHDGPRRPAAVHGQAADGLVDAAELEAVVETPVVEPIENDPDHVLVTFVYRDAAAQSVALAGGPAGLEPAGQELARLAGTDLWHRSYRLPTDVRTYYLFAPGSDLQDDGTWHRDPLNPRRFVIPLDDGGEFVTSLLELRDAPPYRWSLPRDDVARGRIDVHPFESALLGNERRVFVYTPPGYDETREYPLLVQLDGGAAVELLRAPTVLDNLIAERRIEPLIAVMPDSLDDETRLRELRHHRPFVDFLTDELLPWARGRYAIGPGRATISGLSAGGQAAVFAAFERPDVFEAALSQSGSFWWAPDGEEPELLARMVLEHEPADLRFWLDVGILENVARGSSPSLLASNRHLRNLLRARGFEVHYREFAGGHDFLTWPETLAEGLIALTRSGSSGR